jgi:hypothetical protein
LRGMVPKVILSAVVVSLILMALGMVWIRLHHHG